MHGIDKSHGRGKVSKTRQNDLFARASDDLERELPGAFLNLVSQVRILLGALSHLPGQRPVRSSAGRVGPPSGHARPSWGSRDLEKWLSSRSLTVSRSSSNRDAYTSRGHGGAAVAKHPLYVRA